MSLRAPGAAWDEHRNTSRVFPVPPDALPAALRALQTLDPALRAWIEAGAPRLTEADHLARFGEPYRRPQRSSRTSRVTDRGGSPG